MTLTIDLEPELLERLHEKATREGRDPETIAAHILAEALEWEAQDRQDAIEGIQRGLDDYEAGRFRSLDEVTAEKRQRHGL
jgi:predicted transcriptional regulator